MNEYTIAQSRSYQAWFGLYVWYADKPPIADLQYFLDFQGHKIWAPVYNDLPLGPATNKVIQTHTLQFSLMGPKLHVNTCQVLIQNDTNKK